jgi:hypothetical protein
VLVSEAGPVADDAHGASGITIAITMYTMSIGKMPVKIVRSA